MKTLGDLRVKIFADGADKDGILKLYKEPFIKGFTTNPTLMRRAGIKDYESFAKDILQHISDLPFSFEVFSDDFEEMEIQAKKIATWGDNVNVKIPVTNTKGASSASLVGNLANAGVKVNVTAMMTVKQVKEMVDILKGGPPSLVSLFAGRVADTGRDPLDAMKEAADYCSSTDNVELIWASPRELLNIFHADEVGCHIITVTHSILNKLKLIGKDLDDYSLDTVKMFYNDAREVGYSIL